MADIKRTVTIDYKVNGLETAKKNIDTLKVNLGGTDQIADLERQSKDLAILMAKVPEGMTEGPLIDEINERYTKLLKSVEKARIAMLNLVDPEIAPTLDDLNNQLEEVDENLLKIAKEENALKSKYLVGVEGTGKDEITTTKSARKEALGEAKGALTEDQQMLSVGGRKMSDAYAYLETFKKYKEVLDSADVKQAEILEKLEAGKDLTKEEKEILSEKLKTNEYIKLNADQINEQYKIRKTLLDVEQDIHKEARATGLAILADRKDGLEIQREAIKANKDAVENDIGETQFSKESEDILKSNTDAQIEHIKAQEEAKQKAIELEKQQKAEEKQRKELEDQQKRNIKGTEKETTTLGKAAKQVFNYGIAFSALKKIYRETIKTITDLDKAMTEMTIVTNMSRKEAWDLVPTLQNLAKETGFTTTEISSLATEYLKQGKSWKDTLTLTEVAAKAARIAGISAKESVSYLTAAVNGFGLAADEALAVSDRFAALAAASATDYEELAVGLSKFAAQARVAGISIDFAMGLLAKGVETTREAPETIGTAIKTVLSRMRELTDYGKTLEDGMDLNRVDSALKQVGIRLTDANGNFRDMEEVLKEVGNKWDTLNKTQQASVAVALAGTRQQSRLIAMMNDFDRTLELVAVSEDSAGATTAQHAKYMESMAAAMTNLNTSWQNFISTITESEVIIGIINTIGNGIENFTKLLNLFNIEGKNAMILIGGLAATLYVLNMAQKINNSLLVENLGIKKSGFVIEALGIVFSKATLKTKLDLIKALFYEKMGLLDANRQKTMGMMANFKLGLSYIALKLKLIKTKTAVDSGTISWTAFWAAATMGVALIITAIVGVIEALRWFNQEQKEAEQKRIDELYQIRKLNSELEIMKKNIEDINKKTLKIEADYEELDQMAERIREIEKEDGVKIIVEFGDGIDWEQTKWKLDRYLSNKKKEEARSLMELMSGARGQGKMEDSAQYFIEAYNMAFNENDFELLSVLDYFSDSDEEKLSDYFKDMGKITEEGARFLRSRFAELFKNGVTDPERWKTLKDDVVLFNSLQSELTESSGNLAESIKVLRQFLADKGDLLSEEFKNSLKGVHHDLTIIEEKYGELILANEDLLKNLKITPDAFIKLANAAAEAEVSLEGIFETIGNIEESLPESVKGAQRWIVAAAIMARNTKDATLAQEIFNVAFNKSTLELTQNMDKIENSMKNLVETQKKFLSGDMTDTEFFNFVEDNLDLFADEKFFNAFISGADLSLVKIHSLSDAYTDYQNQLIVTRNEIARLTDLDAEANKEAIEALEIQERRLEALLMYRGELKNVTEAQYEYANALKALERLEKAGFDTIGWKIKLLEKYKLAMFDTIQTIDNRISDFYDGLPAELEGLFDIVDGIIIVNQSVFNTLDDAAKASVEGLSQILQSYIDEATSMYYEYYKQTIELAEEEAKAKKKIYEDYFKALDKMEEKRQRKQSREDLIKQLQRLQGATDEASRKRAIELRKELNQLDEDTIKDETAEAREALISGIDEALEKLKETLIDVFLAFISSFDRTAEEFGPDFIQFLIQNGVITQEEVDSNPLFNTETNTPDENWSIPEVEGNIGTILEQLKNETGLSEEQRDILEKQLKEQRKILAILKGDSNNHFILNGEEGIDEAKNWTLDEWLKKIENGEASWAHFESYASPEVRDELETDWRGFSKGGLVDYTGIAQVHGSARDPEMVLSADQTQMFFKLRDALASFNLDGGSNGNISIENITIQTNELNNNQDFANAGKVLATEFKKAISRRGISINAKK